MNQAINLEPIDDLIMSKLVEFKQMYQYYPTLFELEKETKLDRYTLNTSLNRLKQLNKIQFVIGFDKRNPYVKG